MQACNQAYQTTTQMLITTVKNQNKEIDSKRKYRFIIDSASNKFLKADIKIAFNAN